MLRSVPLQIHYMDDDGVILCQGVDLEGAASELNPPRITIHYCDVTCVSCRRWFTRTQRAN